MSDKQKLLFFCGHCISRALIEKRINAVDDCPSRRGTACAMCGRKGDEGDEFFAYPGMENLIPKKGEEE